MKGNKGWHSNNTQNEEAARNGDRWKRASSCHHAGRRRRRLKDGTDLKVYSNEDGDVDENTFIIRTSMRFGLCCSSSICKITDNRQLREWTNYTHFTLKSLNQKYQYTHLTTEIQRMVIKAPWHTSALGLSSIFGFKMVNKRISQPGLVKSWSPVSQVRW